MVNIVKSARQSVKNAQASVTNVGFKIAFQSLNAAKTEN